MLTLYARLASITVCCVIASSLRAATLAPTATLVAPGEDTLSAISSLGTPGPVWFIPLLQWEYTAPITVEVPVIALPGDPGTPISHSIFLSAQNLSPDDWQRFSIEVDGPATIGSAPLPSLLGLSTTPVPTVDSSTAVFDDLTWSTPDPINSVTPFVTINFTLDVTPPEADEPVRLTLRPVPEPGSAIVLIGVGGAWMLRRRSTRLDRK